MTHKILFWDNDGTITGAKNPDDTKGRTKGILPGVEATMKGAQLNIVISGTRTAESNQKDWDVDRVTQMFMDLMRVLPIHMVAFSPLKGGTACYVLIKKPDGAIVMKKAHEEERYQKYQGHFKKPDIGMLVVLKDTAAEEFCVSITPTNSLLIGDMDQDKEAAHAFGIPFVDAQMIHGSIHRLTH